MELPDHLDVLRQHRQLPAPPPVPSDWKPGLTAAFFGPRKPWGDYAQARALIRHGKILEARELLERLVGVPRDKTDWQAEVLLCLESLRPPQGSTAPQALWRNLPEAELDALVALRQFSNIDYQKLQNYLPKIDLASPSCPEGAAALLMAFVATSDLALQIQISVVDGKKDVVGGIVVIAPVKAIAFLLNRQHEESWETFTRGIRDARAIIANYKKDLKVTLSPERERHLTEDVCDFCKIGLGLVLFDLGFDDVRREHFKSLAPHFAKGVAKACQMLA